MDTIFANNHYHTPVTEAEFSLWLASAKPGAIFQYHDGFLVVDVAKGSSAFSRPNCKELVAVARLAWWASEQHIVHLVQRRLGPNRFAYLAIARVWPTNGAAALSAILAPSGNVPAFCATHDMNDVGPWGARNDRRIA